MKPTTNYLACPTSGAKKKSHLLIYEIEKKPKTSVYAIDSNHDKTRLGTIRWWGAWRQYVFLPTYNCIWSDDCLSELVSFMKNLKEGENDLQKMQ